MTVIKKINFKKQQIVASNVSYTLFEYHNEVCNIMGAAGCPKAELPALGDVVSYFDLYELYGSYDPQKCATTFLKKKLYI
jgi:hypothetical protein